MAGMGAMSSCNGRTNPVPNNVGTTNRYGANGPLLMTETLWRSVAVLAIAAQALFTRRPFFPTGRQWQGSFGVPLHFSTSAANCR